MKLERAIKVLKDYKMESAFEATFDFEAALKLGIEALKCFQVARQGSSVYLDQPLSGETED